MTSICNRSKNNLERQFLRILGGSSLSLGRPHSRSGQFHEKLFSTIDYPWSKDHTVESARMWVLTDPTYSWACVKLTALLHRHSTLFLAISLELAERDVFCCCLSGHVIGLSQWEISNHFGVSWRLPCLRGEALAQCWERRVFVKWVRSKTHTDEKLPIFAIFSVNSKVLM